MPARVVRVNGREVGVKFTASQDEIAEFVATYNEEIQSMAISTKENIHIVLPGYTDQAKEKNSIDTLLDLGPETKH
jgi:flagellar capping protein FliD